jgi:hypothetical protein
MASNALFKGKIGGSRVAAKWLIWAFSASKGTQNHAFFTFLRAEILESRRPKYETLAGFRILRYYFRFLSD